MEPRREEARKALADTVGRTADPVMMRRAGSPSLWKRAAGVMMTMGALAGPFSPATADTASPQPAPDVKLDIDAIDKAMDAGYYKAQDRSASADVDPSVPSYAGERWRDLEVTENPETYSYARTDSEYGSVWDLFSAGKSVCEVNYSPNIALDATPDLTAEESEEMTRTLGVATCLQGALTEAEMTEDGNYTARFVLADLLAARATGSWHNAVHTGLDEHVVHQMNENKEDHPVDVMDDPDRHDMTSSQERAVQVSIARAFARYEFHIDAVETLDYQQLVDLANHASQEMLSLFEHNDQIRTVSPLVLSELRRGNIEPVEAASDVFPLFSYGNNVIHRKREDHLDRQTPDQTVPNYADAVDTATAGSSVAPASAGATADPKQHQNTSIDREAPVSFDQGSYQGTWLDDKKFRVTNRETGRVENNPANGPAVVDTEKNQALYAVDGLKTADPETAVEYWNDHYPDKAVDLDNVRNSPGM